jgi:hypothetical protein
MSLYGRTVYYHGSLAEAHGYYSVARVDELTGRFVLYPEPNWDDRPPLYRVREESFTVVQYAS